MRITTDTIYGAPHIDDLSVDELKERIIKTAKREARRALDHHFSGLRHKVHVHGTMNTAVSVPNGDLYILTQAQLEALHKDRVDYAVKQERARMMRKLGELLEP